MPSDSEVVELRAQLQRARELTIELRDAVMAFSFNPDNAALAFSVGVSQRRLEDALGIEHK